MPLPPKLRSTMLSRLGLLALSLVTPGLLAACSGGKPRFLNAGDVGKQISSQLSAIYPIAPPLVRCPPVIKVKKGRSFDCTTTLEQQPLTLRVTIDDSKGRFTPKPKAAVINVTTVVQTISAGLQQQGGEPSTVSCGSHGVLVKVPGDTFSCSSVTGAASRVVLVTVLDLAGKFRYQLQGA